MHETLVCTTAGTMLLAGGMLVASVATIAALGLCR